MIDLRYTLSVILYKLKNKLTRNKKKYDETEEDYDVPSDYQIEYPNNWNVDQSDDGEMQENGNLIIPEDEEDEGSQAKMLRRKHILLAAGSVLFIGAGTMAYTALNPTTPGGNENKKVLSQNTAQAQNTDLPAQYSDISKYDKKNANQTGQNTVHGQNVPPASGNANNVNNSVPAHSTNTSAASSRTNSQAPAVNRSSAPRVSVASATPAKPQISAEEKAALKAEQEAKKAEDDAMNSSIAFAIAKNVTQSVANNTNTASASSSAVPVNRVAVSDTNIASESTEGGIYMLHAGTVIPATLQTGITSDSPNGDCVAIVRQDVYDSLTGTHLLIPQGAKIIGKYGQGGARGNHRIGVVFTRIILPDGQNIDLPQQAAIDGTGMPGLADKYTNHTGSLFRTAFMTALLGSAAQSATGNTSGDDNRSPGQEAVSGAVAQVMETASRILDREGNVNPTITISPGYAFNIFINQDLSLGEYDE